MEPIEVYLGDEVIRLDGTVVEVLSRVAPSRRFHVNHVAVEAKPKGDHLRLKIGLAYAGAIAEATIVDVPNELVPAINALFEQAKARRTA